LVDVAKLRLFSDTAKFSVLKKLNNRNFFSHEQPKSQKGFTIMSPTLLTGKNNPSVAEATSMKAVNLTGIMSVTLPDGKKVP